MRPTFALIALALAACSQAAPPEPNSQQTFPVTDEVVAIGDTVWLGNTGISVEFREVRQDSRCPTDVVCAWSGNAEVFLVIKSPSAAARTEVLNSTVGTKDVVVNGYRIELKQLDPAPLSTDTRPRPYVAHLAWRYLPD